MKNKILFMLYALCLGAIIGAIIWGFLRLMNLGIEFIWEKIPEMVHIPFYAIIVCTLGGIIVGVWKKFTGDYPEELEVVIEKTKKRGRYNYNKLGTMWVSAILPLIFGASVGPEAGLIGIIVGLCSWISDKFKNLFKEMKELTKIGLSATLGTIFNSPMFGFALPIESEEEISIPKRSKIILYFLSIFGALGISMLLGHFFGGSTGLEKLGSFEADRNEWLFLIPLSIIGVIFGLLYIVFNTITRKISRKIGKNMIIKCTIAGLCLGITGTFLPYVMFSGEEQMGKLAFEFRELGIGILLLTAVIKLFMTNVCNNMGLKGGHLFPCIFVGICLGYAFSLIFGINPEFSVCVITTSLMAFLMKKPFAVVLLLMICFPAHAIPVMLIASVIGSFVNLKEIKRRMTVHKKFTTN